MRYASKRLLAEDFAEEHRDSRGGIGADQFSDPKFVALHIHEARLGVPWNIAISGDRTRRAEVQQWLTAAKQAHVTPLISFGHL